MYDKCLNSIEMEEVKTESAEMIELGAPNASVTSEADPGDSKNVRVSHNFDTGLGSMELDEVKKMLANIAEDLEIAAIQVSPDWLLLQRKRFDVTLLDEPYHALQLLVQPKTGTFIQRIWGRTRLKGTVGKLEDLRSLCWDLFHKTIACLGFFDIPDVPVFHNDDFDIVAFPVKRQISKNCLQVYKLPDSDPAVTELLGVGMCSECLQQPKIESGKSGRVKKEELDQEDPNYDPNGEFYEPTGYTDDEDGLSSSGASSSSDKSPSEIDDDGFPKPKKKKKLSKIQRTKHKKRNKPKLKKVDNEKGYKIRNDYSDLVVKENGRVFYRCPKCDEKKFLSPRALNYHRSRQHHFGPFLCQHCQEIFDYADELYSHYSSSHSDNTLSCPCCTTETFTAAAEEDFLRHYRLCFRKKSKLERISNTKKQVKKKIFPCEMCQKRFVVRSCKRHRAQQHRTGLTLRLLASLRSTKLLNNSTQNEMRWKLDDSKHCTR